MMITAEEKCKLYSMQTRDWPDQIEEEPKALCDDVEVTIKGYGIMTARQSMNMLVDIVCQQESKEFIQMDVAQLEITRAHIDALIQLLK